MFHEHEYDSYFTKAIAITPATTDKVPLTLARVNFSTRRKKIAPSRAVQIGEVAVIGDTVTTEPMAKAWSMNSTAMVSPRPLNRKGKRARRSHTNFSWFAGVQ
jgi:hypothetical protein